VHVRAHTHTHTHSLSLSRASLIPPLSESLVEGFFWNHPVFWHYIEFNVHLVAKCGPLRPIFRIGNNQESLEMGSKVYSGWVMTGKIFSARKYCTTSDVWLSVLSSRKNYCPCHFSHCFLQTASFNLGKLYMYITSNTLFRHFELMVLQTMIVKEFCDFFDCPS
jgi:hypothetical protein